MRFVSRAAWGARPPESRTGLAPTFGTTLHHEGPTLGDFPHTSCASKVRGIQAFHMDDRGWSDVAYTAIVCPHGYTFECRWVGVRTAANGTNVGNDTAYAVCYLGGIGDVMPAIARDELVSCFRFLDEQGGAGEGVNGHRDWKATECPGADRYAFIPELSARVDEAGTPPQPNLPPPAPITTKGSPGEEAWVRSDVQVNTDANGNGWRDTGIPFDKFRAVSVQGWDPPTLAYLAPRVEAHNANGQVRVSIQGAYGATQHMVYVAHI